MAQRRNKRPRYSEMPAEFAELELGALGELGDTMAEFEGGTINVAGGIPGERAVVRIYRYRRRRKDVVSGIVSRFSKRRRIAPRRGADTVDRVRVANGSI